jgi:hypothetical protein
MPPNILLSYEHIAINKSEHLEGKKETIFGYYLINLHISAFSIVRPPSTIFT